MKNREGSSTNTDEYVIMSVCVKFDAFARFVPYPNPEPPHYIIFDSLYATQLNFPLPHCIYHWIATIRALRLHNCRQDKSIPMLKGLSWS